MNTDSDFELCVEDNDSVRSGGPRAYATTQPGFQRVSRSCVVFSFLAFFHYVCSSRILNLLFCRSPLFFARHNLDVFLNTNFDVVSLESKCLSFILLVIFFQLTQACFMISFFFFLVCFMFYLQFQ